MSSLQLDDHASTAPSPGDGDDMPESRQQSGHHHPPLSADRIRQVVRLLQCPVCSRLMREPLTLPCGGSLCRQCLPSTHTRTNITYPATPNRLQAVHCPLPGCSKEHAVGDCGADVALNRALAAAETALTKIRESEPLSSALETRLVIKDQWRETGVPSLREPQDASKLLSGGRLLATFALVQEGGLDYNAQVSYPAPTAEIESFDGRVLEEVKEAVRGEMDCQVCYAILYDPVTTPCGHTFCRFCLQRVIDHARYCPVCRRELFLAPMIYRDSCPANQLLNIFIHSFWEDQLEPRRQTVLAERMSDGNSEFDTPIFVCTLSFPTMPTFLHVFEPRYRLMMRRALEADRTFGMVIGHDGGFREVGTLVRIVNIEFFPDGRSLLETVGVSRFRIVEHGTMDGYIVAKTQPVNDVGIADEEELEVADLQRARMASSRTRNGSQVSLYTPDLGPHAWPGRPQRFPSTLEEIDGTSTRDLMDYGVDFIRRMQARSVGWLTARILSIHGDCPTDPALFPWWFASIFPVKESEKYQILLCTNVRERLKVVSTWIMEWETDSW